MAILVLPALQEVLTRHARPVMGGLGHEVVFVVIFNVQISSVNYSQYPTLFLSILQ